MSTNVRGAASCADDMRREFSACLRFAQGQSPAVDSVDGHVRAFLAAASQLEQMFMSKDDTGEDNESADLQDEIAALRQELEEKEKELIASRDQTIAKIGALLASCACAFKV